MGQGTLTIYSASAGSGKTFNLAGIYLAHLFRSKYNYRKILAVTFTNKATAEMKDRILDQLYNLVSGENSEYLPDLLIKTGKTESVLRKEAGEILFAILHDFSRFSVCTIDAFFQKIVRAFARESGLHSGFNIEIDNSVILSSAVEATIAGSATDQKLENWLNEYVSSNLDDEKSWNLKEGMLMLSRELFKENFRIMSEDQSEKLADKDFLLDYIEKLKSLSASFTIELQKHGQKCLEIFSDYGLTDDMFFGKSRGVPGYIRSIVLGKISKPSESARHIQGNPPRWSTGEPSPELLEAINGGLGGAVNEAITYYDTNILNYNSAKAVLSNIFALGILRDVRENVRKITTSENTFLISDAGDLLYRLIRGDQTPFIYEKIGNRFENYMIDEFQDTSWLQWKNFSSLIEESMGRSCDNLVVGDVKQSIYRFRNSDWKILGKTLHNLIENERFLSKPLVTNWRSRSNIIRFNNALFTVIPEIFDSKLPENSDFIKFTELYSEAVQKDPRKDNSGYVRIEFIENEKPVADDDSQEDDTADTSKWNKKVLEKLPSVVEALQDSGYNASDIGILVRSGKEGADVLKTLIGYAYTCPPDRKTRYNYNVVSNDSLVLSNSPAIIFIISVLKVLSDPHDTISMAQILRFYLLAKGDESSDTVSLRPDKILENASALLPEDFTMFFEKARQMTLYEATEYIIGFFGIGNYPWNVSYLSTFQDLVINFTGSRNTDFLSFIDWWETTGKSESVVLPANQDAAKVFTIHKSKGLEFKVVILPFISWHDDHESTKHPILWVKPEKEPFDMLGIVPVRYNSGLSDTIFEADYLEEKYSAYIDNLNLLYVAMTRAVDVIWGFAPDEPGKNNGLALILKEALTGDQYAKAETGIALKTFYNGEKKLFEYGKIPENKGTIRVENDFPSFSYTVTSGPETLKLKLHGENYFSSGRKDADRKINYGKLMHEVFEGIDTAEDIAAAVSRIVMEGKLPGSESAFLITKLYSLISAQPVSDWFRPGNSVMKETDILLPSGVTKRPDRVILMDGKAVVIDFKFGVENKHYTEQIEQYRNLLADMGYRDIDAFLWYVDNNKIVRA
ncbi:MAG: UvrD-helicase domain-containing protein [Bacteroidales bacterium]|jgi:ATP-dependent exoDNAse (exonuclease V) beta subunit|nr:UvrD-helicase domain-containing protein [Bacteroidales bacterium]